MQIPAISLLCLLALCQTAHAAFDWALKLKDKKVDCAVNTWTDWKCSGSTCGRTRKVIRPPRNGGRACPTLQEAKSSNSKDSPWDQTSVPQKVHSKFLVGNGRVLSFAKTATSTGGKVLQSRDLMFLVDMSGSIKRPEFKKTKEKMFELIGLICGTIGKTRQHNRIAVITFSKSIKLNFDFKTVYDMKDLKKKLDAIPQERSLTCTGDAFHLAHSYMFDPKSGVRDATESVKEVLVLTDGKSNCGRKLPVQVKKLQVKAFVFALAIGKFSPKGRKEIESMVSRPLIDHIFSLSNFEKFFEMVDALKSYPADCVPFELTK